MPIYSSRGGYFLSTYHSKSRFLAEDSDRLFLIIAKRAFSFRIAIAMLALAPVAVMLLLIFFVLNGISVSDYAAMLLGIFPIFLLISIVLYATSAPSTYAAGGCEMTICQRNISLLFEISKSASSICLISFTLYILRYANKASDLVLILVGVLVFFLLSIRWCSQLYNIIKIDKTKFSS